MIVQGGQRRRVSSWDEEHGGVVLRHDGNRHDVTKEDPCFSTSKRELEMFDTVVQQEHESMCLAHSSDRTVAGMGVLETEDRAAAATLRMRPRSGGCTGIDSSGCALTVRGGASPPGIRRSLLAGRPRPRNQPW